MENTITPREPLRVRHHAASDFLYESARVRSLENKLVGKEKLARLAEAKTADEVLGGVGLSAEAAEGESDGARRERLLEGLLTEAYREVENSVDPHLCDFLRLPYDANNIKAILKCRERGVGAEPLMLSFGSVPLGVLTEAMASGNYEALPVHLAGAIDEARRAFAETRDPQRIDFILDRAAYADILDAARASGVEMAYKLAVMKVDLTNLLIVLRLIRMNARYTGKAMLADAYLEGGSFSLSALEEYYEMGESAMLEKIALSDLSAFGKRVNESNKTLSAIELCADNTYMDAVREALYVPFGAEVLIGYTVASETAVKNLRILMAGKEAGLSADTIRERMRDSYV